MRFRSSIFIFTLLGVFVVFKGCIEEDLPSKFVDEELISIYEYVDSNKTVFSSFLAIMETGGLDVSLSANNPHGSGYTLFLPDDAAVQRYIDNNAAVSSLEELLSDAVLASEFCRYHVLNMSIRSNDFPYGAFPQRTLTEDFLTVSFFAEEDSSYYMINNQSTVIRANIELSNGYIHYIENALIPVTFTTRGWLEMHDEYSIFRSALKLTGLDSTLNQNADADESLPEFTLFLESDQVYQEAGINEIADLESLISPGQTDYTNEENPLYQFVAYHILEGNRFIDDFDGKVTLYNTLADIPLSIDGEQGIEIAINLGKEVFDTIISSGDTILIDYIGFFYDESNVLTQSGSIHMINQVMTVKSPSAETRRFDFKDNKHISNLWNEDGSHLIEGIETLKYIDWIGSDLYWVVSDAYNANNDNYLSINGDFEISYNLSKMVPGKYSVHLRAHSFSGGNPIVEVFVDSKPIRGFVDLTKGGNSNNPFNTREIGTVQFNEYTRHTLEIKTLIPGRFLWDWIEFRPN